MRIEPLELTCLPFLRYGSLSTITTFITTPTNCNSESYSSSDDGKSNRLPRKRTAFTDEQLSILENAFQKCPYPKIDVRMKLASETQLPEKRIQVWFKNRRAKYRKKMRNISNPEITSNNYVPKFNAVITWKPNVALIYVTPSQGTPLLII